jgi:hypothetical protein
MCEDEYEYEYDIYNALEGDRLPVYWDAKGSPSSKRYCHRSRRHVRKL